MYSVGIVYSLRGLANESPLKLYYDSDLNVFFFRRGFAEARGTSVRDVSIEALTWFDPRPVTEFDIELLSEAISERFGTDIANKVRSLVLSSLAFVSTDSTALADHVMEFFINGEPLALAYFDLTKMRWDVVPRKVMVALLVQEGIDLEEHGIVLKTDRGRVVGTALIASDGSVNDFDSWSSPIEDAHLYLDEVASRRRTSWLDVYRVNEPYVNMLVEKVRRAVEWLERDLGKRGFLAFSGGKDSVLAACLLTEVESNFCAVYTHIEHGDPEGVRDYVLRVSSRLGFKVFVIEHEWKRVREFVERLGMPFRGYRWCTQVLKFYPQMKLAKDLFGLDKIVSYTGSRKYETAKRSAKPATYIDVEMGVVSHSVPYKFPRLLEYLVLRYRYGVELFEDYERGFERLSCIACPYKTCFELKLSERTYREDFDYWVPYIRKLCKTMGMDAEIAMQMHVWRIGFQLRDLASIRRYLGYKCRIPLPAYTPTKVSSEDIERCLRNVSTLFPDAKIDRVDKAVVISWRGCKATVSNKGVKFEFRGSLEKYLEFIMCIEASINCIECGICSVRCRYEALKMPLDIDASKCRKCFACILGCPVAISRLLRRVALMRGRLGAFKLYRSLKERRASEYLAKATKLESELYKLYTLKNVQKNEVSNVDEFWRLVNEERKE